MSAVAQAAVLALGVGCTAQIGAATKVSMPLRMWLADRKKPWSRWLFDLVSCPFCSSVWLAAIAAGIYRPPLVHMWAPADYVAAVLAISAASMLPVLWIRKALKA